MHILNIESSSDTRFYSVNFAIYFVNTYVKGTPSWSPKIHMR